MKKFLLLPIALLFALSIIAQSPHAFKYQAVVRNPDGTVVENSNVSFEIVILQTSRVGIPVYTETHNVITNDYGVVNLEIGNGDTSDELSSVDWGADNYFMRVSMDIEGGTDYQEMGTTQLLSVPYALYSETAENIPDSTVTSAIIRNGEVQADDLADGAALAEILDDDGTESGLDADLLDGQSGNYYFTPKIAFYAYNSSTDNISTTSVVQVEFNSEKFDIEDNYSTANDEFTAPYAGIYNFEAAVSAGAISSVYDPDLFLYVNGTHYTTLAKQNISDSGTEQIYSGSITIQLEQGDVVDIRFQAEQDNGYFIRGTPMGLTRFCGHLVSRTY